jgi:hypothetical protein
MAIRFPELSELLGHDTDKVRSVAQASYRGTAIDLQGLQCAPAANDRQMASSLAQHIQMHRLHFSRTTPQASSRSSGALQGIGSPRGLPGIKRSVPGLLRHTESFAR